MRQERTNRLADETSAFRLPLSRLEAVQGGSVCGDSAARRAFTLVELLVVIAIIALLAGLLLAAVGPAQTAARRAAISTEISNIDVDIKDSKNIAGSFPPNAQTDGTAGPLNETTVLARFKRYFNKRFPSHREPEELIAGLVGLAPNGSTPSPDPEDAVLDGGMNAAEALVFWIGGFSDDPKYPITGTGGPSYRDDNGGTPTNSQDPLESRNGMSKWKIDAFGPRNDEGFYHENSDRFILYQDPRPGGTVRRINFWMMRAGRQETAFAYFDVSRGNVTEENDPPGHTAPINPAGVAGAAKQALAQLFAIKSRPTTSNGPAFSWANNETFQILHAGVDDAWGTFPQAQGNDQQTVTLLNASAPGQLPTYPEGPWNDDLRDTQTNFAPGTLEDQQP